MRGLSGLSITSVESVEPMTLKVQLLPTQRDHQFSSEGPRRRVVEKDFTQVRPQRWIQVREKYTHASSMVFLLLGASSAFGYVDINKG
jgi:hypothetical protein